MTKVLELELEYYHTHLDELLEESPGKFALIKADKLIGAFDTNEEALSEGARRFGLESFLVRKITRVEEKVVIPALTLGLLGAGSTRPD